MSYFRKKSFKFIVLLFIFLFFILNCIFFILLQYPTAILSADSRTGANGSNYPHPIDVVYTWVNGSDPQLLRDLTYHKAHLYLDSNFGSGSDLTKLHCPFPLCGFNDHFLLTPRPPGLTEENLTHFIESLWAALQQSVNVNSTASVSLRYIGYANKSIYSRKSGVLFQHSVSMSSLFINQSQFDVTLVRYPDVAFSIHQIYVAATDDMIGYPVSDHVFLSGFSEMRDVGSEASWREIIMKQLPNDTRLIKASATSFLISLPHYMDAETFKETFNTSAVSTQIHVSKSVLIIDLGLVTVISDISESRYQDNDELKYSLRSLSTYVNFHGHVFIVTNGQVPSWLNTDHPGVTVVPHWQIFANKSHLPTFNSAAIEANLHRIPGLAPHFIYLNDDVFFGKTVFPEDFYSPSTGYKVYLGWSVPNCVEACPSSWLADGFCDHDCNVAECQWDSGDCIKTGGHPGVVNFAHSLNNSIPQQEHLQSMLSAMNSGFCSQGCNSNWLADRYCDQACNVDSCGYDLGDCGDVFLANLPFARLRKPRGELVFVANGTQAFVVNLQDVIEPNDEVTKAMIDDSREILAASYAVKYRLVVIAFHKPNSCKDCYSKRDQIINVNLTLSRGHNLSLDISTSLVLNCHKLHLDLTASTSSQSSDRATTVSHIEEKITKYPEGNDDALNNISLSVHSGNNNLSIEKLEWDRPLEMSRYRLLLQDGLISVAGYHHLVHELWLSRSTFSQSDIRMNAFSNPLIIENLAWGFLPWENQRRTTRKTTTLDSSNTNTMRHPLDLYAESLRYSNRILSEVYYANQRRVPAHGPHFINVAIINEAQKKSIDYMGYLSMLIYICRFHRPWSQTATHRFRSPNDMQFAFTYFYFLMAENITVPVTDILHSVDTDHSGSLSVNEIRSLLLRLHPNATVSFGFLDQITDDIRNSCVRATNESRPSFNVDISELATCYNWSSWHKSQPVSRYRFTAHEESDLAFIMISTGRERVLKELDSLRKTAKKFFCLNDNLPNSDQVETVVTVRKDVKEFLDFMFPFPSPFERPSSDGVGREQAFSRLSSMAALALLVFVVLLVGRKLSQLARNGNWSCRFSLTRSMHGMTNVDVIINP